MCFVCLFLWLCSPARAMASSYHEIRTHDRSKRVAVDLRLRRRGHSARLQCVLMLLENEIVVRFP
jgi:hypothetical protein